MNIFTFACRIGIKSTNLPACGFWAQTRVSTSDPTGSLAMRLINCEDATNLFLVERFGSDIPPYAILSHTWGQDDEELTYKDMIKHTGQDKAGFQKMKFCAEKDSSSELSEAINSMYRWYHNAAECYVFLIDVSITSREPLKAKRGNLLSAVAGGSLVAGLFKSSLLLDLSIFSQRKAITGVPARALDCRNIFQYSMADRMTWTLDRHTKRGEYKAYCLFGLLEIFLPPICGEGQEHALKRLQDEVNKCSHAVKSEPTPIDDVGNESIASWLQPAAVNEDLLELLDLRHDSTCQWIFGRPEFEKWIGGIAVLWLHGKPGSGKSVLTATLIDRLRTEGRIIAYFFCKLGDDTKNTLESILRAWLSQILEQLPEYRQLVLQHKQTGPPTRTLLDTVKLVLKEIARRTTKQIFLVVDGFDECEAGALSAEKLLTFVSALGDKISLVLSSRTEIRIIKAVSSRKQENCFEILVTNDATREDLNGWIRACIDRMGLSDLDLERSAFQKLEDGADGMFLWARFQLETLEAQFAVADAREVLRNDLPKDLEATYERLLLAIESNINLPHRAQAFRILQWITAAHRPFTVAELDFALAIQIDSEISPKGKWLMRGSKDVLSACGSFVEITRTGHICSVHASAREFLRKRGVHLGYGQVNQSSTLLSNRDRPKSVYIARACATVLTFQDNSLLNKLLDGSSRGHAHSLRRIQRIFEEWPFLDYAVLNWWKHFNEVPSGSVESVQHTLNRFLGNSQHTLRWIYLYQYLIQIRHRESKLLDPSSLACWKYIRTLWNQHLGQNPSTLFNRWQRWHVEMTFPYVLWPPIHLAAFFNLADRVDDQLLLGVPVDLKNRARVTPLMQAAHGDSPDVIRILLHHGASMQSKTMYGYTIMHYACRNSLSSLRLLFQAGGRIDEVDGTMKHTALHDVSASVLWHPTILITILDLPYITAIISWRDRHGQTALDCAIVIDPHYLVSRSHDSSYEGLGGIEALDGSGARPCFTSTGPSDFFAAQGPAALLTICKAWHILGIGEPNECTSESVLQWLTTIKEEIIRRLINKGAKTAQQLREHELQQ
ncbi:hypothetical protein VTL71DRAFT_12131 [Oculimacula yallundae]|uniref:NACHT domain-containing protein n=1 Tax=Oculimacula yallundae TaxID=86028 RepID=A0ABR4CTU3_9HELO